MTDHPIEGPRDTDRDVGGVIDLAEVRIRWGRSTVPFNQKCEHKNLTYNNTERRVWCDDCSRTIDNYDALMVVVNHFDKMDQEARRRYRDATEAFNKSARLRATKELDRVWSGNVMAVACPHCKKGLLPEDFAGGASACWSRELEIAERKKRTEQKP